MEYLVIAAILAFLPAGNALARKHNNAGAIVMTNVIAVVLTFFTLFFGVIPWLIALVWSCTSNVRVDRKSVLGGK